MDIVFVFMSVVHLDISQMTVSCVLLLEVTVLSSAFHLTYIATSSDPWTNLWRWLSGNSTLFQYSLEPLIDTKLVVCWEICVKAWMRDLTLHFGVSTLRLGEWEEVCPEYYRYYDGDMSQDGCDQSEQASFSAWLSFLVVGSNATESIDNGRFFQKWYQIKFSSYIHITLNQQQALS